MLLNTTGGYVVELRGKSGEVQAGRACSLRLYHRDYRDTINVSLQTDERGRIQLGRQGAEEVLHRPLVGHRRRDAGDEVRARCAARRAAPARHPT